MNQPFNHQQSLPRSVGDTWNRFWFEPVDALPLAFLRVLAGTMAIVLWASYALDLEAWFGPQGIVSAELIGQWRSPWGVSLFDAATTRASLWAVYAAGGAVLVLMTLGAGTAVTTVLGAVFFTSLLQRGPMLVGPADDVTAVLLWCVAIGRSGDALSVDRLLAARLGDGRASLPPRPSFRTAIAMSLVKVHASVIAAAAVLAQLKGDVWWDGSAAWWLAAKSESRLVDLTGVLAQSEYVMNLLTHAITLFEIVFAIGLWCAPTQRIVALAGLVAWPLIGGLAGEPLWGLTMAIVSLACVPWASKRPFQWRTIFRDSQPV